MIVKKVLNNNVLITLDEHQQEQIVMGRGIAFKKKAGDQIEAAHVDKIFRLANQDTSLKFQELLAELPLEIMQLSDDIICYAKTHLAKELNDTIFISITDHLHTAIERLKQGIALKNFLLWDIKRFFPEEFAVGLHAIEIVKAKTGVELPEDEAGYIALHFVNAAMEEGSSVANLTNIMQEITNIVKYYFKISFNEDSVYFYRFSTHLKFFVHRLLNEKTYQTEDDEDLVKIVIQKYPNQAECVAKIAEFLLTKYDYTITSEEKMYLIIHIARIVKMNV